MATTTTVYPRLFEVSIMTFRAGYLKRVIDTGTVYSRLFEFPTTLTFRALHRHKQISLICNVNVYVYVNVNVYVYLVEYVRECAHLYVYDLPQWFHVFCYISPIFDIHIYKHVIMNRHGSQNIRNGIARAQTGHGTFT